MATMQGKKKDKKQHGSKLRSFYLSCRGHLPCSSSSSSSNKYLPINPVPISQVQQSTSQDNNRLPQKSRSSPLGEHQNEAAEVHWRRVSELERQLVELEDWLHMEVARLMSHLGTNNNSNNNNRNTSTNFDGGFCKVWRLDDNGGYLYSLFDNEVLIDGALCQDLTIQISSPAIVPPEDGSTISGVLSRMAMMGRENLVTWLLDSIPMTDISIDKPTILTPCTYLDPRDIQEGILLNAIPKLRELVLEGLQIQMGAKEVVKRHQENTNAYRRRGKIGETKICVDGHGGIIMVVLIQPRDPQKAYRPVNEMMIGLIEAANVDEEGGFVVNSVHVAGLMARRRNGKVISNCLWSL